MKYLILIAAALCTTGAFAQMSGHRINDDFSLFEYTYDRALIKKNKVASITIDISSIKSKIGKHRFYFDTTGILTLEVIEDTAGNKTSEYYFTANSYGDLIGRKEIDYKRNKTYLTRFDKKYVNDKLVKDSSSAFPSSNEYTWNDRGQRTQCITRDLMGGKMIVSYTYDNRGRLIEATGKRFNRNDTAGIVYSRVIVTNDDAGRPAKVSNELMGMFSTGSKEFIYDEKGLIDKVKTSVTVDGDTINYIDTYTYSFHP